MKKLSDVEVPLANFLASGLLALGDKLGPILWQLPANFPLDLGRLEAFLHLLPRSHQAIAEIATLHTREGIETVVPVSDSAVRHVLEIRNPRFPDEELREMATKADVCLAASHSSRWPYLEEETSDFMYFRLHGPNALYGSSYSEDQLQDWADRIARWHGQESTQDVYVYFDNDGSGHAPRNALRLQKLLEARGL
jgi:uncharacterized protein YecE (DUF72 family)